MVASGCSTWDPNLTQRRAHARAIAKAGLAVARSLSSTLRIAMCLDREYAAARSACRGAMLLKSLLEAARRM